MILFSPRSANIVMTRMRRAKMPRMWDCCSPAAEMAACSRRASLFDIFWRFLMMARSIPNPESWRE